MQDDTNPAEPAEAKRAGPAAEESTKGAQTLMRALDILDEVIEGPVRAVDLSRKLGLTRTTTHRLVHALKSRNYLAATKDGFSLGPKLLQLGAKAGDQVDFVRVARPFMESLSERTGFCVFVGKREGDWSRHLDRVTGRQRLRVATAAGDRRPIAETGLGKALLLDDETASLERLYREAKGGTVAFQQLEAWKATMRAYVERGIVTHESDLGDGVRSIAVPVRDAKGEICVAISIASAAHYLDDVTMQSLAGEVKQTADKISATLGFVG